MKVIKVTEKEVKQLNKLDDVSMFPDKFTLPILGNNVQIKKRKATGGKCAYASKEILKGEIVCYSNSSIINKPIKYSWQIGKDMHLIGPGAFDHMCQTANCGIDVNNNLVALRNIMENEFLTFNYLTTEYEMSQPFSCVCGDKGCYGYIQGFRYLTNKEKQDIIRRFPISNFIKSKYDGKSSSD